MRILLLSTSEKNGGAAIACNRLMHALNKNGVEATMLVRDKQTEDPHVVTVNTSWLKTKWNKLRFIWERGTIFLINRFSKRNLFQVSIANTGNNIVNNPLVRKADVIHLHWVNQGFLSIHDIHNLVELGKPIVWTMHDQWCYTGICHYVDGCEKFEQQCTGCPKLVIPKTRDVAYRVFNQKKGLLAHLELVGCSHWMAGEANKSFLTRQSKISSIPNPIDIEVYSPMDKQSCRQRFNLPTNKKLILFGACKVTDKRKGIDYLVSACKILTEQKQLSSNDMSIVVFGGNSDEIAALLPYTVLDVGYIYDNESMIQLYNAVDLFLIPSLEDNLPNTIMESMSCGTPCVGFKTGGIPEMIDHLENGYVAESQNAEDLANGILWVLQEADYSLLSKNAIDKVKRCYSEDVVVKQYIEHYRSLL